MRLRAIARGLLRTVAACAGIAWLANGVAALDDRRSLDPASLPEADHTLEKLWELRRAALAGAGFELRSLGEGGERLRYFDAGSGEPLLFLHGAGDQAGTWFEVAPAFSATYRLVVLDLPGHGESEPLTGDLPMATVVAGAERMLAEIARERPAIVVGNSMGAWIATLLAHRHPEQVARLVLVNGGAVPGDPGAPSLLPASREDAARLMTILRDPDSAPVPDWLLDELVRRAPTGETARMLRDLPGLFAHMLPGRLGEIAVPADLLWGASDRMMTPAYAERMAAQLPASRLTFVEKCGHIPQLECAERFRAALADVLALPPARVTPAGEP
ncbi:MAG TPA: alpha/beta fold hydrolase [Thermoanaerobaculia bacterium]|nr:alpha/beta fold hydrolase [Thermoanaerobaculia bacterium]